MFDSQHYSEFGDSYRLSTQQLAQFYEKASNNLAFYAGDQFSQQEREYLASQRRNVLTFNKVRKIVNLLSGYQRQNRQAFSVRARSEEGYQAASQLSRALQRLMLDEDGYAELSHIFTQVLKTGFNIISIWQDFSEDPISGDLRLSYVPWNSFFIDPSFSRIDLRDCAYMGRRAWVTRPEAKNIFPWDHKMIDELPTSGRDSLFPYLTTSRDMWRHDLHKVDEFWTMDHKQVRLLVDPKTGQFNEWPEDADEQRLNLIMEKMPHLQVREQNKQTVRLRMFLDEKLMYDGNDPLGLDDYNFVPFVGFFDQEQPDWANKVSGVIDPLQDPQKEANRRRSKILDMIDSQINSGWVAEENSVVNPADLYQSGQGKVVWTKQNQSNRIQKLQPADVPQGFFQSLSQMDQDILSIAGVNEDMLGQSVKGEERSNALLAETRRNQGMMTVSELFDNYYKSKREVGFKLLRGMQENYTANKIKLLIGEDPAPRFFMPEFGRHAVALDSAVITSSQKELQFQQLMSLREMGAPIPWAEIVGSAPVERKDELMQMVKEQEQQQAQQAQRQQELQTAKMEEDVAGAEEDRSQAIANKAKAWADVMKTEADIAQTEHNIESSERDQMLRLLEVATQIDDAEQALPERKGGKPNAVGQQ